MRCFPDTFLFSCHYFLREARLAIAFTVFGFGGFFPFNIWLTLRGLGIILSFDYFFFLVARIAASLSLFFAIGLVILNSFVIY
jgi:hypothetical protein